MKHFLWVKFLYQLLTIFSIAFLFGTMSAWEQGQISAAIFVAQLVLFSSIAWGGYRLSYRTNRKLVCRRIHQYSNSYFRASNRGQADLSSTSAVSAFLAVSRKNAAG